MTYLSTLGPTYFYRDPPEFINTAFALGVSHPAGFPTYNLLANVLTWLPLGSIAFRINLFSALMGIVTLVLLYWVSGCIIRLTQEPGCKKNNHWAQLLPTGLLAFCYPFWGQTMLAEVYTLHSAFTCLLIGLLCEWKLRQDVRYLFAAAAVLGLASGNHATSGFFLPAILWLFFCWCKKYKARLLSISAMFFLFGFLVYAYLPIRSYAEPSFDWGNPETVEGFLFQVTDRKDASYHFNYSQTTPLALANAPLAENRFSIDEWFEGVTDKLIDAYHKTTVVLRLSAWDLTENLSYIAIPGLLLGGWLCFRKSPALLGFFAIIAGINISFFMHWRQESYLPTYIIVSLLTSLALSHFLSSGNLKDDGASVPDTNSQGRTETTARRQSLVWLILALLIPYALVINYFRVDRSGFYNAETLSKRLYLSLPSASLFVPGLSWFQYFYHQDVERLRDDVTAIPVWDLLNPNPPSMITRRRYPGLEIPNSADFNFKTKQGIAAYVEKIFSNNSGNYPIVMEPNLTFFEQTHLTGSMQPWDSFWVRYAPNQEEGSGQNHWQGFHKILEEESQRSGARRDMEWNNQPWFFLNSMVMYYHDTHRYDLEAKVLTFMRDDSPGWILKWIENLLAREEIKEARMMMDRIPKSLSGQYEIKLIKGLVQRRAGQFQESIEAFEQAAEIQPGKVRPQLELARTLHLAGKNESAKNYLEQASLRLQNVRQWVQWEILKQAIDHPQP